jgi:hypothetical protein
MILPRPKPLILLRGRGLSANNGHILINEKKV